MKKTKAKIVRELNVIKRVLEDQDKTQTWLAEKLDRDFVTVTRYVNNKRQPSLETLFDIAQILKVNPKELLNS
jgi:transcriptional regulator with XRE-family HTH domain